MSALTEKLKAAINDSAFRHTEEGDKTLLCTVNYFAIILMLLLTATVMFPAIAMAEDAVLLAFPVGDVAVVNMDNKVYPVRLMGINVPGSSLYKFPPPVNKSIEQVIPFLQKKVRPGEKIRLEFGAKREDNFLQGYLAAYIWLKDGRMLNEEIIKAGFGVPVNEGKYFDRLVKTSGR